MQYARPSSDISNNGEWTNSSGPSSYLLLDEVSPSDADYIQTTASPTGPLIVLGLSAVTDPVSSADHTFSFRAVNDSPDDTIVVSLYQGATLIASKTQILTASFATYTYTLSGAEADAITDYSDLRVQILSAVGSFSTTQFSWFELEVPDEPEIGSFTVSDAYLGSAWQFMHDKPGMSGYGQQDMVRVRVQNSKEWQGNERMKGDDPIDEQDAMNGGVCSLSGQWFPGHSLVKVGGKQYGRPYAPSPEQNRKGIPRLPGD